MTMDHSIVTPCDTNRTKPTQHLYPASNQSATIKKPKHTQQPISSTKLNIDSKESPLIIAIDLSLQLIDHCYDKLNKRVGKLKDDTYDSIYMNHQQYDPSIQVYEVFTKCSQSVLEVFAKYLSSVCPVLLHS